VVTLTNKTEIDRYWQLALWLAIFTIFYNLAEVSFRSCLDFQMKR
jgi:hypothetical protein